MREIKLSKLLPFIITKPLIVIFGILSIIFPWGYFIVKDYNYYVNFIIALWIFVLFFIIGFALNLFYVYNKKLLENLGLVGWVVISFGYIGYLIISVISTNSNKVKIISDYGVIFAMIVVLLILIEYLLALIISTKAHKACKLGTPEIEEILKAQK